MTDHLSTLQLKKLCVSALPADELAAAAVHTDECQFCHQQFVEELKLQRGATPFNFTLEPASWFRDDHLDFERLVALADKTLDPETKEITDIHLQSCESCREDVRSFLAYRKSSARELERSYAHYRPTHEAGVGPLWQRFQARPVYVVAAIVLLAVAFLIGVIALNRNSRSLEAIKLDQGPGRGEPSISPAPAPSAVSRPSTEDDNAKVAILKDRGGEVSIAKNGRVTGLDEASENSREYIARAALAERLEAPEVLRRLAGDQSELRGTDDGPQEFKLEYPVRNVVIEDRPVFHWKNLAGASSHRVYVLDADGKQVSQSEELPPTQTQWKAPKPLRRGQVFSWVVSAMLDGKKVVSPAASDPEIKFAVLATADLAELGRLRKTNSSLALGTFYTRVGLLNEAKREFESLIKLNPDSDLARKLLQSVRSMRTKK